MIRSAHHFWPCLEGAQSEDLAAQGNKVIRFTNPAGTWFLKQRASKALCDKDLLVTRHCQAAGFPVPQSVPTDQGDPWLEHDGIWWTLTLALAGQVLSDLTPQDAALIGSSIAGFHNTIQSFDPTGLAPYDNPLEGLLQRLNKLPGTEPDANKLAQIFETFHDESRLTRGIIHRDAHPGNMHFEDGELTGIFDFDQLRNGPLLFDPCYCANSQIASLWTEDHAPEKWLGVMAGIMDGYFGSTATTIDESAHVFEMLLKAQLAFLIWLRETGQHDTAENNKRQLLRIAGARAMIESRLGL